MNRCKWSLKDDLYIRYHDTEWGKPIFSDQKLFEYLILETFQAGLSWYTILKKRDNFRLAFDNFSVEKVARYDTIKIAALIQNKGIIRNKLKIQAAITNAQAFLKVQQVYGSFADYIWAFVNYKPIINHWKTEKEVPASTQLSEKISKDLKQKGFKKLKLKKI